MTFVYILLVLVLVALVFLIYRQSHLKPVEPDLTKAIDALITVASQKLGEQKQVIQTDLAAKKESIEVLVKRLTEDLDKNQRKLETAEAQRIGNFESLKKALEQQEKLTRDLSTTTEGLKRVLSNNQQRGAFGEKVAEDLLKMSGFVIGTDYTRQESSGEGRPDFTLYLPDKTKINIDSKFPYSNIVKMSEATDSDQKTQYKKLFEQDIKKKISDVTSRNYINLEDNTVDFVILFIPNEMIFSFIYESFPDIWQDALNRKVVMTGPFSFTAILRMVRQAYENFKFQKNVQSIITQIKIFGTEFEKYNEEFNKIGDRLDSLHKQYDEVSNTRSKKLQKVIDRINIEAPREIEETL